MEITKITEKNAKYFEDLMPIEFVGDEETVNLSAIDDDGEAVSAISLSMFEKTAYIEWIFTDPDKREKGAASALLDKAISMIGSIKGIEGIEIAFSTKDDNLEDFLMDRDFLMGRDEDVYCVPVFDILYSAKMDYFLEVREHGDKYMSEAVMVEESGVQEKLEAYLKDHGLDPALFKNIATDYSVVCLRNDEITGCILLSEIDDDVFKIEYMLNDTISNAIPLMLAKLHDMFIYFEDEEGYVFFSDRSNEAVSMLEDIVNGSADKYRVEGLMHAVRLFV